MPEEETELNSTQKIIEDFKNFDFSPLWEEPEEGGLMKIAPLISVVISVIILIIVIIK